MLHVGGVLADPDQLVLAQVLSLDSLEMKGRTKATRTHTHTHQDSGTTPDYEENAYTQIPGP